MADHLHRGVFKADLLLHALNQNLDKPCEYLPQRRGDDPDPDGGVEVDRGGALPHLHAAQPRVRRVLHPDKKALRARYWGDAQRLVN